MCKRRFDSLKERLTKFAFDSDISLTDLIVGGNHGLMGVFETERDLCDDEGYETLHLLLSPSALKHNPDLRYLNSGVKCGVVITSGNRTLSTDLYVFRVEKINALVHPEWRKIGGVHYGGLTFASAKFLVSSPTVSQENKKKLRNGGEFVSQAGRSLTKDEAEHINRVYVFLENKQRT